MHCIDEQVVGPLWLTADQMNNSGEMNDLLKINLTIAGRKIPFTIKRSQEELYRRAEREVNEKIAQIKAAFQLKEEEIMAYTALLLALDKLGQTSARAIDDDMEELKRLDRQLEAHLSKLK